MKTAHHRRAVQLPALELDLERTFWWNQLHFASDLSQTTDACRQLVKRTDFGHVGYNVSQY